MCVPVTHSPICSRDLSTSGGMATSQLNTPAMPPANIVLRGLSSVRLSGRKQQHGYKTYGYAVMRHHLNYSTTSIYKYISYTHTHIGIYIILMAACADVSNKSDNIYNLQEQCPQNCQNIIGTTNYFTMLNTSDLPKVAMHI